MFEQAICTMCDASGEEPPEEDLDVPEMGALLLEQNEKAKVRLAKRAEEAAARKAEAEARRKEEEERKVILQT